MYLLNLHEGVPLHPSAHAPRLGLIARRTECGAGTVEDAEFGVGGGVGTG